MSCRAILCDHWWLVEAVRWWFTILSHYQRCRRHDPTKNCHFWPSHSRFMPPLKSTRINIHKNRTLPEILESPAYISADDSMGLTSFKFIWCAQKMHVQCNQVCNGHSRSSKLIDSDINRKQTRFLISDQSHLGTSCTVTTTWWLMGQKHHFSRPFLI